MARCVHDRRHGMPVSGPLSPCLFWSEVSISPAAGPTADTGLIHVCPLESVQLSVWKTDSHMRPIHIVSYDEQPGCSIKTCVMGPTENNAESGAVTTTIYYGVNQNDATVVKWANDQGYTGIVQVSWTVQTRCSDRGI